MSKHDDIFSLGNFISEQTKAGGLNETINEIVKALWNEYKEFDIKTDCTIITADFGRLGSLVFRTVDEYEDNKPLIYKEGSYDYISIISKCTKRILWTDYNDTEPYNRQSGLYCDGASFESLGHPVKQTKEYREFNSTINYIINISFGVWGYSYNTYYNSITFGICIKNNKVDEFVNKLRIILGKTI
jgi:hypothetical protein